MGSSRHASAVSAEATRRMEEYSGNWHLLVCLAGGKSKQMLSPAIWESGTFCTAKLRQDLGLLGSVVPLSAHYGVSALRV